MDVVNAFIKKAVANNKPLTQLSLYKLIYIANGFSLAVFDELLVEDVFEAWKYGPVVPEAYEELRYYEATPITQQVGSNTKELSAKGDFAVNLVYEIFKDLSAFQLVDFTHKLGGAWQKARNVERDYIYTADIKEEYQVIFPKEQYTELLNMVSENASNKIST